MRARQILARAVVLSGAFSLQPVFSSEVPGGTVVTLEQCVDEALRNGPDARISRAALAIGRSQYEQAVAGSSLGLSGSVGASRKQPVLNTVPSSLAGSSSAFNTSGPNLSATNTAQAGLSLSQASNPSTQIGLSAAYNLKETDPLGRSSTVSLTASQTLFDGYAGGRNAAAVEQSAITVQSAEVTDDSTRKSIAYNVKQAYYAMLAQQRQIAILQETLEQRRKESEKIRILSQASNATRIDVEQAQVNQKTAELDLKLARSTLEVDREKLSNLTGWPAEEVYTVAEVVDQPVPSLDPGDAVKTAIDQRADLRQLRFERSAGAVSLALQKSKGSPTLSADGGVTWTRDWANKADLMNFNLGVTLDVPILDAGLVDAEVRQARLQNESYDVQIQQKAAGIATEVKNAIYSLRDLTARKELAESSLELASDQYELAQAQYEHGVISTLDLLEASVAFTTAEVNAAKAGSDVQVGVLALQNVMGY